MPKEIVVIGPPGTGKTTAGITLASGWFKDGASSDEVAYLAFTKAAADEASRRIKKEGFDFDLPEDQGLPFFRTLHSLAYRALKKDKRDLRVVRTADMKNFSAWAGFTGTFTVDDQEDITEVYARLERNGRSKWDDCLSAYGISRISATVPGELEAARTRTSRKAQTLMGRCFGDDEYRHFVSKYEDYKRANGLVDFTDMLEYALAEMEPLGSVRHVVVDEVQDLSPLLYAIVDRLFLSAEQVFYLGDVNQTLYAWAAADPKLFISRARRAAHRVALTQTHRFGDAIVAFSTAIINRATDKIMVQVKGLPGREHSIRTMGSFEPKVRDMLILHRHVAGCQALAASYIAAGLPFRNERGRDPLGAEKRVEVFQALHDLAAGKETPSWAAARLIEDYMPSVLQPEPGRPTRVRLVVHGAKKKIEDGVLKGAVRLADLVAAKILTPEGSDLVRTGHYQALEHSEDFDYYRKVIENGHPLNPNGRIPQITTIHGSKGREAPSVTVFAEMGRKCWNDPDPEHRIAYVASTRTQGTLEICVEKTVEWARARYDYPEPTKEAGRHA